VNEKSFINNIESCEWIRGADAYIAGVGVNNKVTVIMDEGRGGRGV
jgi:hypothetical protein